MKLTPKQEESLTEIVADETLMRIVRPDKEIAKLLGDLKCPTCGSPLMFGGESSVFRFVALDDLGEGWQDGKSCGEGAHFLCQKNERHAVYSVVPKEQDVLDYLELIDF